MPQRLEQEEGPGGPGEGWKPPPKVVGHSNTALQPPPPPGQRSTARSTVAGWPHDGKGDSYPFPWLRRSLDCMLAEGASHCLP